MEWKPGCWCHLGLRVLQFSVTAISYLILVIAVQLDIESTNATMCLASATLLQAIWSIFHVGCDIYSLKFGVNLLQTPTLAIFLIVESLLGVLLLGATCSVASILVFISWDVKACHHYFDGFCGWLAEAIILAFVGWTISASTALRLFWLCVKSLHY